MSIQAVAWALDQDLPARPKLVLVSIANHADHTDGYCWLKATTIAAEAACGPRSVYRFVGGLIRNGYLRRMPRKGADGKQRATDYWVLFNRIPATWDWAAGLEAEDEPESESAIGGAAGDGEAADDETQDVDFAVSQESYGDETVSTKTEAVDKHVLSPGPSAIAVTAKNTAEPSKTNPLEARARGAVPRTYRPPPPPPPQPVGSIVGKQGELIFVFKPSRGYDAWKRHKEQETGRIFNCEAWKDGRCGWYFPALFPPEKPPPENTAEAIDPPYSKTG